MENQIYMYYNKLSARYEGVFSFATDAVCQYRLGHDKSFDPDLYEVVKVGSYNLETGIITSNAPIRLEIIRENDTLPVQEVK